MQKQYITAQELLNDSWQLALSVIDSHYKPDLIVGVWRGGTPVAIALQEALKFAGIESDHIAIRTQSYNNIEERHDVSVDGLEYLSQSLDSNSKLLIVDDVFDTGLSLDKVIKELQEHFGDSMPEIKIATAYFKPANNRTARTPDYFVCETQQWLVFPHELLGLSDNEILQDKPGIKNVRQKLLSLRKR